MTIPANCLGAMVSFRIRNARMHVPTGSPRMPMETIVADISFNSRLNTNCPPMVERNANPRKEHQVSAGNPESGFLLTSAYTRRNAALLK